MVSEQQVISSKMCRQSVKFCYLACPPPLLAEDYNIVPSWKQVNCKEASWFHSKM